MICTRLKRSSRSYRGLRHWQIATEKEMTEVGKTHADMAKTRAEIEKIKSETFENVTDAARNLAVMGE